MVYSNNICFHYEFLQLVYQLLTIFSFNFRQESASLVTANGTKIVTGPHAANSPLVESQPNKKDRGKPLRQIIAAFVANLGTINTGLIFGFSAVVIPQLEAEDSVIPITESQASWIGKCISLFCYFIKKMNVSNLYIHMYVYLLPLQCVLSSLKVKGKIQ